MRHLIQSNRSGITLVRQDAPGRYRHLGTVPVLACRPAVALIGSRALMAVLAGQRTTIEITAAESLRLQLYSLLVVTGTSFEHHARAAQSVPDPELWVAELGEKIFPIAGDWSFA